MSRGVDARYSGPILTLVALKPFLLVCKYSLTPTRTRQAMANATDYGLANAVFSSDAARCARVSNGLQSGVVWQNCSQVVLSATPFSGLIV